MIKAEPIEMRTIPAAKAIPYLCEEKMRELVAEVGNRIYQRVAEFEISAWPSAEPVVFAQRMSSDELKLSLGDKWGENLFDCAWFRFRAKLPNNCGEELVARIDINGELFIADENGNPVRGLTCKKSVFERKLGTPGKTIYALPKDAVRSGFVELWADAAWNDLFGTIPDEGRIETAEVCVCRHDIRALYYDLEVLVDFAAGLKPEDQQREQVVLALSEMARELGQYDPESVAATRALLKPLFCHQHAHSELQISAIGHAHLDLAWLWPIRETIRKGARTFATALYNFERYPDYIFGMSQPQLFAWIKESYPALYARIKEAVRRGQIELQGTFWVEPDCNIPSGESFVRQVVHGSRFFRDEFGKVPRFCWQPDVFGYHGQLPQILKKSGHDYFMTQKLSWNVVNRFPYHSFHWKGIDGTAILTHMLAEETYNGPAAPHSIMKIAAEYAQREVSGHALMAYGIGDGGGGPDAEHMERLKRIQQLPGLPTVKSRSTADFFQLWKADQDKFPCWQGELYLERHQGTLTTQGLAKRNNRQCEIGLRELEWVSVLAESVAGIGYPAVELDRLWKEVLLYQFHDILPGSSIKRVYDECNARYVVILELIEKLVSERYLALSSLVQSGPSPVVFNSLPWARNEWLQFEGQWHLTSVPGMGYAQLGEPTATDQVTCAPDRIENERLRAEFAQDGSLRSVFDKVSGRELLADSGQGNDFVVFTDTGDAWDFATNIEEKDVWIYLRQTPERPVLAARESYLDGPCAILEQTYSYQASKIHQRIILRQGSDLLEFDSRVTWAEPRKMLRVRFPVSIHAGEAHFEIPFGSICRSTGEENLHERAQLEVPAQQWVDISDAHHGVSLLNDCKYGFRVKGHTLDMCLLRSVPHPGNALIGKEDRSQEDVAAEFTDLGEHQFRYALRPHVGAVNEAEITRAARAFNIPLRVASSNPNPLAHLPSQKTWIQLSNPAVEIPAIKRAEDLSGWILRLVNVTPAPQETSLIMDLPFNCVEETDLVEKSLARITLSEDRSIHLKMAPFEIKSFRIT